MARSAELAGYFRDRLAQGVNEGVSPGMILNVQRKGETALFAMAGEAALYPVSRSLTEDTLFDIASLTKIVATTVAIMLLWERKQLELTSPVQEWLSDFRDPRVTIEHLLAHTSGCSAWQPLFETVISEERAVGRPIVGTKEGKERMVQLAIQCPLEAEPGERQLYSDLGFILLGEIIERASGVSLDEFCNRELFEPLSMERTFFNPLPALSLSPNATTTIRIQKFFNGIRFASTEDCPWRGKVLNGEVHDDNAYAMGGIAGHAGLFAPASDLARFAEFVIRTASHRSETLLMTSTLNRFVSPPGWRFPGHRLGWDVPRRLNSQAGRHFSPQTIGHLGYTGCSLWIDLERECAVILLTNRVHPSRENKKLQTFRPVLHDELFEKGVL